MIKLALTDLNIIKLIMLNLLMNIKRSLYKNQIYFTKSNNKNSFRHFKDMSSHFWNKIKIF